MISYIEGEILKKTDKFAVVVSASGLGFKILLSLQSLQTMPTIGTRVKVWCWPHLKEREGEFELYGFLDPSEQDLFELLLSISGIGPKKALSILSKESPATLKKAFAHGDVSYLTKVLGLSSKIAQKLIAELRDKVKIDKDLRGDTSLMEDRTALDVLVGLGLSRQDAKDSLDKVSSSIQGVEKRVKEVLRQIQKDNK